MELGILGKDKAFSRKALAQALATTPVGLMAETTARNLRLIREGRGKRNERLGWDAELEAELDRHSRK